MYGLLHYPGDVTHLAVPGRVLGESAFRIPYEVIDSEYDPDTDLTTVNLQHASAETMRRLMEVRQQVEQTVVAQTVAVAPFGTPPPSPYSGRRNGKNSRRRVHR
jgi:hypothetical protein